VTRQEIAVHTGYAAALAEGGCEAPPLAISLFGPLEACCRGIPLPRLRTRKGYALLALLAVRHGGPVERSWLAGTLWPESSEAQALANLRNSLKDLRRALGEEAGRLGSLAPRALRLELGGAAVDVLAFDEAVARGDAVALAEAVALYRGPLLEGWTEEWIFQERQAQETKYLAALETLAEHAMAQHEPGGAEQYLRRAVATDPLRESAQRGLMQALAAGGNYAGATKTYRDLRLLLHRELNAEPDAETAALFQQIRAESRQRTLSRRTSSDERPTVGAASFTTSPPHPSGSPPHNLPRQLTRFIGREREMTEVKRLLSTAALLTVTGAGGCGKTRLALQAGEELLGAQRQRRGPGPGPDLLPQYQDGVWLVELASLSDPALVPQTVALALRVQEEPGRPLSQTLAAYLQPRSLLLVLDNCEHLLAACTELADTLLRACPDLRILATSREVLGIAGEQAYRVPSLSLPDPRHLPSLERLLEFDAVRLFVDRAVLSQSTFAVTPAKARAVVEVCQRLDGMPLAIELAAARVKALSVEKLNERLDDMIRLLTGGSRTALPRHQTLRALIDWSYDLLSEAERTLLRRLSVFAGGWTLEAAEAVGSGDGLVTCEVLELLTQLVEKSLVVYEAWEEEDRYRLLETIRQYAWERLQASGESAVAQDRHRDWAVALAERAEPELFGRDQATWLERLEREHDNLRAALTWATERGEAEVLLRLAGALWFFWKTRGHLYEGRECVERALVGTQTVGQSGARAKVLDGAGELAWHQGDFATARARLDESMAIWQKLGDKRGLAYSFLHQGWLALNQDHNYATLGALHTESLALFRELGDGWGIAQSLLGLGLVARSRRDYVAARAFFEEDLAISRELGDKWNIAWALDNLGTATHRQGNFVEARALHEESMTIRRGLGDKWGIASELMGMGTEAMDEGAYETARPLFEESLALQRELGDRARMAVSLYSLGRVAQQQGDCPQAISHLQESLRYCREAANLQMIADCLEGLAGVAGTLDQPERMARLFGAAEALRERVGSSTFPIGRGEYERDLGTSSDALGEEAFAAAWAAGRVMSIEDAIDVALQSSATASGERE
jgi:predicted ATPase/DNA-binding SARP family transcriptional activator